MKKVLIVILVLLTFQISFSQTDDIQEMKNWQLLGFAKNAERIGDVYTAVDFYSEYYKRNNKNKEIAYKLALLYFNIKDYKNAKHIYSNLVKTQDKKYYKSRYYYAKILKIEGNYLEAISNFQMYIDDLSLHLKGSEYKVETFKVLKEIEGSEDALKSKKGENQIQVIHLNKSINKAHMESAPILWNDTLLIYSSLITDTLPKVSVKDMKNVPVNMFYSARLVNEKWKGEFEAPKPFINLPGVHTSNGVFSLDRSRFYFTVSEENFEGKKISSIYVSIYKKGIWQDPVKLDKRINYKNFTSTQPSVGKCYDPNLEVIYFISDRPGGYGGFDIWYTIFDKPEKKYKSPINAGSYINTPGNEVTPFFDKTTKSLYYSSDFLAGFGGYDVFKSIGELVNWTPSQNVGAPINTGFDEFYYTHTKEREHGFIVSNRKENTILKSPHCCFDIFEFKVSDDNLSEIKGTIYESQITIRDKFLKTDISKKEKKDNPLKSSVVELHIENDNTGELIFIERDTTNLKGEFKFNIEDDKKYQILIIKDNFTPTKLKINTENIKDRIIKLDSVKMIPLDNEPIQLQNIYFEFNETEITKDSKSYIDSTLLSIMKENKDLVIEISAHTDGIGDADYNLELSKKRAESVVNHLIQKGIKKTRTISIGWGETKPLEKEIAADGSDIPKAREKNRRIELRVVGKIIENKRK